MKLLDPATLGVPEITPVDAFSDRPAGSVPVAAYVYGPVPPVAVTVWLYAVPAVPAGNVVGSTVTGVLTVML